MSSFRDIKDPWEREATIKDYLATVKRIQKRNEGDRLGSLSRQYELEKHFQPVVKSQEKMAKEITKSLIPLESVLYIHEHRDDETRLPLHKRRRVDVEYGTFNDGYYGPLARAFKAKVLSRNPDVDTSFGIYFTPDGRTMMGKKYVKIYGDDIIVDNEVYNGTKGLWALITGVKKNQIGDIGEKFTENDLLEYIRLVRQTSVLHQNFDPENNYPRSNSSWKWKHFLKNLWIQLKEQEEAQNETDAEKTESEREGESDDERDKSLFNI